ncbi:ATP-dependent DNA helicase-like protein RECG, chloroplastic-like [Gossypium australe]|uniref:ATP-dependent DNA helicase-like protein RECG, chloroplastic-like n=1 Tax=Gossypium australe TaxID=47621 RepID=A0A5B6WP57_9ROSI|nr:ATP-dependent DNA helicase-like protein RECG, chloroplastic-like [Gossypium australe]
MNPNYEGKIKEQSKARQGRKSKSPKGVEHLYEANSQPLKAFASTYKTNLVVRNPGEERHYCCFRFCYEVVRVGVVRLGYYMYRCACGKFEMLLYCFTGKGLRSAIVFEAERGYRNALGRKMR